MLLQHIYYTQAYSLKKNSLIMYWKQLVALLLIATSLPVYSARKCNTMLLPELSSSKLRNFFIQGLKRAGKTEIPEELRFLYSEESMAPYLKKRATLRAFIRSHEERLSRYFDNSVELSTYSFLFSAIETEILNFSIFLDRYMPKISNYLNWKSDQKLDEELRELDARDFRHLFNESNQLVYLGSKSRRRQKIEAEHIPELITVFNYFKSRIFSVINERSTDSVKKQKIDQIVEEFSLEMDNLRGAFFTELAKNDIQGTIISKELLKEASENTFIKPALYFKRNPSHEFFEVENLRFSLDHEGDRILDREHFKRILENYLGSRYFIMIPFWTYVMPKAENPFDVKQVVLKFSNDTPASRIRDSLLPQFFKLKAANYDKEGNLLSLEMASEKNIGQFTSVEMTIDNLASLLEVISSKNSHLPVRPLTLENTMHQLAQPYLNQQKAITRPLPKDLNPPRKQNKSKQNKSKKKAQRISYSKRALAKRRQQKASQNQEQTQAGIEQKQKQNDLKRQEQLAKKEQRSQRATKSTVKNRLGASSSEERDKNSNTSFSIFKIEEDLDKASQKSLRQQKVRIAYKKFKEQIRTMGLSEVKKISGYNIERLEGPYSGFSARLDNSYRLFFAIIKKEQEIELLLLHIGPHDYTYYNNQIITRLKNLSQSGYRLY